jgi:hypothetical protein
MRGTSFGPLALGMVVACSDSTSPGVTSPIEPPNTSAVVCNTPTIKAMPAGVTKPRFTSGHVAQFSVRNNCSTTLPNFDLFSSRTGKVTSVGGPAPDATDPLAPAQSITVNVSYSVGGVGSGTVVLTAQSGTLQSTGSQFVTVN